MDQLRPEIAYLVLHKLLTEDGPGPADVPPVSRADIEALSLSCRPFADGGPEYLFKHLWLFMDEDSLAKLSALSNTLRIREYGADHRLLSKNAF